jgi:hypothetical protein
VLPKTGILTYSSRLEDSKEIVFGAFRKGQLYHVKPYCSATLIPAVTLKVGHCKGLIVLDQLMRTGDIA